MRQRRGTPSTNSSSNIIRSTSLRRSSEDLVSLPMNKSVMIGRVSLLMGAGVWFLLTDVSSLVRVQAQQTAAQQTVEPRTVLKTYCISCHNQKTKTGGLALDNVDPTNVAENPEVWEKVVQKLQVRMMPPPGGVSGISCVKRVDVVSDLTPV
jgi:hypothetical protein